MRAILHAGALVPGHGLRFAVHGSGGSWLKHGLDPQEDALRGGAIPGAAGWGREPQPGTLLRVQADGSTREVPSPAPAGDYLAYYAQLRDAIAGRSAPPVCARDALQVMRVIEAGLLSDAERREIPLQ
jgi:predicted dehydrogenase